MTKREAENIIGLTEAYSREDLHARYLALCRRYHPDGITDLRKKRYAHEQMVRINGAYKLLKSLFSDGVTRIEPEEARESAHHSAGGAGGSAAHRSAGAAGESMRRSSGARGKAAKPVRNPASANVQPDARPSGAGAGESDPASEPAYQSVFWTQAEIFVYRFPFGFAFFMIILLAFIHHAGLYYVTHIGTMHWMLLYPHGLLDFLIWHGLVLFAIYNWFTSAVTIYVRQFLSEILHILARRG